MSTPVWISLGSNLGDRRAILDDAVAALSQVPGVVVKRVSSFHETKPIGGPPGQGPFLNAAAQLETSLDPYQLLSELQRIENEAGRVRIVRWGERTLDLDILIFGTKFLDTRELKLPHPRLAFRRFVLAPLAEIASQIVEPMTGRTVADLMENLDRKPRIIALWTRKGRVFEARRNGVFGRLVKELPGVGVSGEGLGDVPARTSDFSSSLEWVQRKDQAIRSSLIELEPLRSPCWIVTDYLLEIELRNLYAEWRSKERLSSESKTLTEDFEFEWANFIAAMSIDLAVVTLVVMLYGGGNDRPPLPGFLKTPQLWPDSDDPEAIVAEVVATCRGIEGI